MPGAPPVVITSPYPLLALIVSVAIVAFCVPFVIYGVNHYSFSTVLMPAAAGIVAAAAATVRIPFDAWNYVQYRRARRQHLPAVEAAAVPEQLVLADELLVTMAATIGSPEAPPKAATGRGEVNRLVVDPDSDLGPGPPSHPHPDPEPAVPSRRSAGDDLPPIAEKRWGRHGQYTRELVAYCWFAFLILASYLFGFEIGVPVFCVLFGLMATRRVFRAWWSRIVFGLASAFVMWGSAYLIFSVLHLLDAPVVKL